ncbi:MAG: hydantoinase B/oxoprolinase family protein, partial [Cyclobacteriaceae bacterium]|nr:hydantoinase B/oxoprolinase family protein [Cyclobacteriaceae bacterium]
LPVLFEEIGESALQKLPKAEKRYIKKRFAYLRFRGQENTIEIAFTSEVDLYGEFKAAYSSLYGHWVEGHPIEVESLKVIAAIRNTLPDEKVPEDERYIPASSYSHRSFTQGAWEDTPIYKWEELHPGAHMQGPAILVSENSTVYLEKGWDCSLDKDNTAHLTQVRKMNFSENIAPEEARLELFTNRFKSIAEEMGAVLQRTSFSVNVKERLDFSCAVLDDAGELVVNAPHIPVHLGSLGLCVRKSVKEVHAIDGDVIITNHPAFGGSHLPDISLIAPVYYEGERVAYIANRAHHAEIGGTKPGSMPADATRLIEEGVVIRPTYLMKEGKVNWEEVKDLFTGAKYPSRAYEENIADLKGALASVMRGKELIQKLCAKYGVEEVKRYMKGLKTYANNLLTEKLSSIGDKTYRAEEWLDNEAKLSASITMKDQFITFDFSGTSPRQSGNLNATESIVHSVVLYVLRLLINKELPLNEGLMSSVKIILPDCFLSPDFTLDNEKDPAVVGGNTEISQRLTDTLLKALELAACSQGTMNNLLFGDDTFGYYETICGGTGAGQGFDGADAVHQHMTNTKITDPEIMEFRYPVVLNEFSIRTGSGGKGKWSGGNGVVRDITFLKPVELTILAQHRKVQPYGMHGGQPGSVGVQYALLQSGEKVPLSGSENIRLNAGDRFVINTPGGGGYSEE